MNCLRGQAPWKPGQSSEKPGEGPVDEQEVGEQAERISQQSLAVAPEPIHLRRAASPAMPLPTLKRNSHHPARPLPDGGSHLAREELAGGNEAGLTAPRYGQAELPTAELVQPQSILVIFRETSR